MREKPDFGEFADLCAFFHDSGWMDERAGVILLGCGQLVHLTAQ